MLQFSDIQNEIFARNLGRKSYELKDHLGNVRTTFSDIKMPTGSGSQPFRVDLLSKSEYYPYGMKIEDLSWNATGARYGYNGKEQDNEVKGDNNSLDFGARIYDPRVARFLSTDPLIVKFKKYPELSPYQFASNTPIQAIDLDGLEAFFIHGTWSSSVTWFQSNSAKEIANSLGNTKIFYFEWSGNNTDKSRKSEIKRFLKFISDNRDPNQPLNIIGHSHGSNMGITGANHQNKTGDKVKNLITFNAPNTSENQLDKNSPTKHINFYQYFDPIQIFGGSNIVPQIMVPAIDINLNLNVQSSKWGAIEFVTNWNGDNFGISGEFGLGTRKFFNTEFNFGYLGYDHDLHNKPETFKDDLIKSIKTKKE